MKYITHLSLFILTVLALQAYGEKTDHREEVKKFMENVGLEDKLNAPVTVKMDESGLLSIVDEGTYIVQYMVATPAVASDPNVIIDPDVKIPATVDKIAVVAHGWIDKGASDWPAGIAVAINECIDPNEWVCAFFDWQGGAAVVSPVNAAEYGRDIAGPRLAAAIRKLPNKFTHVHLIGHSAGSWTINSAAKRIAEKMTPKTIHMTFLDAYVPHAWNAADLADLEISAGKTKVYAEHYYTKDMTTEVTHVDLPNTINVDITDLDPWFKEHEFPYRWYHATITGKYSRFDEKRTAVVTSANGTEYGFKRSFEAGEDNFRKSLTLKKGQETVKLRAKMLPFELDLFKKR